MNFWDKKKGKNNCMTGFESPSAIIFPNTLDSYYLKMHK